MPSLRIAIVVALASVLTFVVACGASDESYYYESSDGDSYSESLGLDSRWTPATLFARDESKDQFAFATVVVEEAVMVEKEVEKEVVKNVVVEDERATGAMMMEIEVMAAKAMAVNDFGESVDVSFQPQNRIIVRNADMTVESNNPASTVDAIGDLAVARGGWVVNSNSSDDGFHNITVRVPAESLDAVIDIITGSVNKVESVASDSTDFTEEYIDLGARRTTVLETVDALTALLRSENYESVEELLAVQREITNWQSELERIDGRLGFIAESAAFSRLSVNVNRAPIPMRVDVGEDVNVGIGVGRKYTARFFPLEGFDEFEITWDFGDGTGGQTTRSALRTQGEDGLLSVPVRHTYVSDEFSPHVVSASVQAYSDKGLARGEDQLWAQVSELPVIDAFITSSERDAEAGQPVTLTASFNHPDTLRGLRYRWDFRDGSKVSEGTIPTGETGIEFQHTFERYRPDPYRIVFEMRGDSEAGEVSETHEMYLSVYPGPSVESADFEPGNTATNAVNVLIAVLAFAGTAGIWLAITSPIWLIVGAIIFFVVRFLIRRQRNVQRVVYVPNVDAGTGEEADEQTSPTEEKDA